MEAQGVELNPKYDVVHRRVGGPTMRAPVTPPKRRNPTRRPSAPGPGQYDAAAGEVALSHVRRVAGPSWGKGPSRDVSDAKSSKAPRATSDAADYDVERGLALLKRAPPGVRFVKPKERKPKEESVSADAAVEDMDGSRRSSAVKYELVERRAVAHSWGRPPAREAAPSGREGVGGEEGEATSVEIDASKGEEAVRPRPPAFTFPAAPRPAVEELRAGRYRPDLNPNYDFGRPATIGAYRILH